MGIENINQVSPEEIKKAENVMGGWQREMSKLREKRETYKKEMNLNGNLIISHDEATEEEKKILEKIEIETLGSNLNMSERAEAEDSIKNTIYKSRVSVSVLSGNVNGKTIYLRRLVCLDKAYIDPNHVPVLDDESEKRFSGFAEKDGERIILSASDAKKIFKKMLNAAEYPVMENALTRNAHDEIQQSHEDFLTEEKEKDIVKDLF
jgi:hypothetical protein